MKKVTTLFLFILASLSSFSQSARLDSLKDVLSGQTNPTERFSTINEIMLVIDAQGLKDPDSSFVIEMLHIAQQQNDDLMLATTYNWAGYNFYRVKGDNTTALEYYFKALPLAERSGNKRRISSLCFDISNVFIALNNTEEAYNYTKRGGNNLPDSSSNMHDYMLVQYQRGMANNYLRMEKWDSALYFSQAMLATCQRIKTMVFRFTAKNLIATCYDRMNEKELADIYFKKAMADGDSIQSGSRKNTFYKNYVSFLLRNNRLQEAIIQTDTLWNEARASNNLNSLLLGAGLKRQLFERMGKLDSAYFYSRFEADVNDKIFTENNKNTIQSLAFKDRLRVIEKNEEDAKAKEKSKQNLQYIFIAFGILTLLMLYLLLSHSFITSSKMIEFLGVIALLIIFEFLNLLLHPFLDRIFHHDPVFMLLALVLIAALLIPLHHRVEKWATVKLIEKNRRIRLAVAKKTIEELETGSGKNG